ncbi:hypothetical protein LDO32_03295 [Luteimonas sp. Y-2-2-4F]|nr:hypothetical protein [Luteimonas sp. Y-2-2-4F]MCD9030759.1 hypothetical protein [Luteimonas sp. Y-2-2-4F]
MCRIIWIRVLLALCVVVVPCVGMAQWRGGSNYNWFHIEGCFREDFGVLKNLHLYRDVVRSDLEEMYAGGQRRLRIGVFHSRDVETGTVINSSGGNLPAQQRQNLSDLLSMMAEVGYEEVMIAFHPIAGNSPIEWSGSVWNATHESYFQENWNLIHNLMPLIRSSPVPYRVDLGNELSPSSGSSEVWKTYVWKLWWNFTSLFDLSESVGFSVAPSSIADRVARFRNTYGDNIPHLFSFHVYGTAELLFLTIDSALNRNGFRIQGVIVGEAFYNDASDAAELRSAINATSRTVHYLTQWPLSRNSSCSDVDVAPPLDFGHYINRGF